MKVFITKYALTEGIIVKEGHADDLGMFRAKGFMSSFSSKEWYETAEASMKRAEEMRLKKIKSLRRQLEKLERLTFDIDDSMLKE